MEKTKVRYLELQGTNYEIGYKLGKIAQDIPQLKAAQTSGLMLNAQDAALARELFDRWCPGLNEEIRGFADALHADPMRVAFYAMTYLKPGCSQMVILPGLTDNGHVLIARNYEFSHHFEDFTLARTNVNGKYSHIGTSVLQFGRDEGINEYGLGVTMSSCGQPVGAPKEMRRPALKGLQFWSVIRALLENCKDVAEALAYLKGMPVAYNINLLLADRTGHAALVETLDGKMAVKEIGNGGNDGYLYATNHAVLDGLKQIEPLAMRNSVLRYKLIKKFIENANGLSTESFKSLLLSKYPQGLCCHYYSKFFGTTKSIVMDLNEGRLELCWGGNADNGWLSFYTNRPMNESVQEIDIIQEKPGSDFFEFVSSEN